MNYRNCNSCGNEFLHRILEAGVPALCPACGPAYSIAKNISNSNTFSPETRSIAGAMCGIALVFVVAMYADKTVDYLRRL